MIREMGNVELFELCETIPKVQCSECVLHWNQGVIYCTCGHLLVENESSQNFSQWRLDAFSIPHKKARPRGVRHGKTESRFSLALSLLFLLSLVSQQVMVPISSSASTASSIDDSSEDKMWNPLLELLFLKHVNGIVDSYLVDVDLAKIALSCHIALDLLCYNEEVLVSA